MTTDPQSPAAHPARRRPSPRFWLLLAVVCAAIGGGLFEVAAYESKHGAHGAIEREEAAVHRAVVKVEKAIGVELPEQFRGVRPAGGASEPPPPIPPSETWPAQ